MEDLRVCWDEDFSGYGHPTDPDVVNRMMLAEHNIDSTHIGGSSPAAYIKGCGCEYSAATAINVGIGALDIEGVMFTIPAVLNKTGLSLTADDWYFVMAAAPSEGDELSLSEITIQTGTNPTWNAAYQGLYTGSLRCIGVFYTNGSSQIIPYYLAHGHWHPKNIDDFLFLNTSTPNTAKTTLYVRAPTAFGRMKVTLRMGFVGSNNWCWIASGDEGDATINASPYALMTGNNDHRATLFTNASAELYYYTQGSINLQVYLDAFSLPRCLGWS